MKATTQSSMRTPRQSTANATTTKAGNPAPVETRAQRGAAGLKLTTTNLSERTRRRMESLLHTLRDKRVLNEQKYSDVVVVSAAPSVARGDSEQLALNAIGMAALGETLADLAAVPVFPRKRTPKLEVLKQLGDSWVMKADAPTLLALRSRIPGLRISRSAWAYLQTIRPLGDELQVAGIKVDPTARAKRFEIRMLSSDGVPIHGVKIKALLDWNTGAHVTVVTDPAGIASVAVPVRYPRVEMVTAEPEHSFWSRYVDGFDRGAAPKRLTIRLFPLIPDSFEGKVPYAGYDPNAGQGVTVGVIDSGVGPHTSLTVAGGRCFVTGEDPTDFADNGIGHGTHVAGIIAARPNGNVYGVAPASRLMAYRVCAREGTKGRAKSADIAAAIQQAIIDQCDIINISMGSLEAMPEVKEMLEKARNAGIVVFASTGNDGREAVRYPGRYDGALAVGALGRDKTFPEDCPESFQESEIRRKMEFVAAFSNFGLETSFIGPGVAVLSTFPHEKYAMMSGTSMATPFSAGLAARLLSEQPDIFAMERTEQRADALIAALNVSTRKVGWPSKYEGYGVLTEKSLDLRSTDI